MYSVIGLQPLFNEVSLDPLTKKKKKKSSRKGIVYQDHGNMQEEAFSYANWAGSPVTGNPSQDIVYL